MNNTASRQLNLEFPTAVLYAAAVIVGVLLAEAKVALEVIFFWFGMWAGILQASSP